MPQPSLKFDTSELAELGHLFVEATGIAPVKSREVVAKGLLNIKTDSRRRISGSTHFKRVAGSITYETHPTPTGAWGEAGPEHGRPQANLAWIPEFGSLKTAPEPFMAPSGEAERPKFEKAMEDLAVKASGLG